MEINVTDKYVVVRLDGAKTHANKHIYENAGKLVHFKYSGEPIVNYLKGGEMIARRRRESLGTYFEWGNFHRETRAKSKVEKQRSSAQGNSDDRRGQI